MTEDDSPAFQKLWGREGGLGAATYQTAISGLYFKIRKTLPVRVRDATNSARHPPVLSVPGSCVEAHGAQHLLNGRDVIHRIRLVVGLMDPAVQAHLECFPDLMLNAGAKLHSDIQVLGLV